MILVDTSVWVEHLRGTDESVTRGLIRQLRSEEELVTTDPVVMELLAGADTEHRRQVVDRLIAGMREIHLDPGPDFRLAAEVYRAVRRQGRTVRSMMDCLIASVALRHDVPVLHRDADYDAISAATGLRTTPA